jgi:hypothetical protein
MATFFNDMSGSRRGKDGDDLAATVAAAFGDYDAPDADAIKDLDGADILFARYCYEDYSGDAQVIFRKDGQLYESTGSHCSCNGLEGQWNAVEVTAEALAIRPNRYREDYRLDTAAAEGWDAMIAALKGEQS